MQKTVLIGHTLLALLIIILVLMQRGKGADAGAAFGAGASGTVFGSRGSSSFFSRATAILATAFFASSLTLAYMSSQGVEGPSSLLEGSEPVAATIDAGPADGDTAPEGGTSADELPSLDVELPEEAEVTIEDDLPVIPEDE
ncbi:MAG: preprotein translocase subunit SecG [Proteobacteria bacterium]|nr:preprotein translocase subunit SecG [Pseudomonadota bacterium]